VIKEILEYSQIDPEVEVARLVSRKLFGALRLIQDPSVKKAFKGMVLGALEFEKELRIKSRARNMVGFIREFKNPEIDKN